MKQELTKENMVLKSNSIINSINNLTALEFRIIHACISMVQPNEDLKDNSYRVSVRVKKLAEIINISPVNAYTRIRDAIKGIGRKSVTLYSGGADVGFCYCAWFSSSRCFLGKLTVVFPMEIIQMTSNLGSKFTTSNLKYLVNFQSSHSGHIYWLAKQYISIGRRVMSLDQLKVLLNLEGKYPNSYDFRKNVLDTAINEINEFTDIRIFYELGRKGKDGQTVELFMKYKRLQDVNKSKVKRKKLKRKKRS